MAWRGGARHRRLLTWILAGATLDAVALLFIWLLLDAIGPMKAMSEYWLDVLGLVVVAWFVHVIALPTVLWRTWIGTVRLLVRATAFCSLAAILIPVVGVALFFFIGLPFQILTLMKGPNPWATASPPSWIDITINAGFWTIIATISGLAIGLLLHALRPMVATEHLVLPLSRQPRLRSDALGGALASFLAFAGTFSASQFGLFARRINVPNDWMHLLIAVPQLPATVIIGVLSLLPHLLMLGEDLFRSDFRKGDDVGSPKSSVPEPAVTRWVW